MKGLPANYLLCKYYNSRPFCWLIMQLPPKGINEPTWATATSPTS